jgi:hypothetical protein
MGRVDADCPVRTVQLKRDGWAQASPWVIAKRFLRQRHGSPGRVSRRRYNQIAEKQKNSPAVS